MNKGEVFIRTHLVRRRQESRQPVRRQRGKGSLQEHLRRAWERRREVQQPELSKKEVSLRCTISRVF